MASVAPAAAGRDRIAQLSPELRLMIFREAVRQEQPIRIAQRSPALDILLTCRLFRAEATEWYYRENTFLVGDPVAALAWSGRVDPAHAAFVRSVQLEVDISPLTEDAWASLGVPRGGHDTQWKGVVAALPNWFPRLEELQLVIVAHLLKRDVGPDAEPRVHRFADVARELALFHYDDPRGCLAAMRKALPSFEYLCIGSTFPRDWEDDYVDSFSLEVFQCDRQAVYWYELADPVPAPPYDEDEDDEDEDDDNDDDDDDDDDNDDDEEEDEQQDEQEDQQEQYQDEDEVD